jgi:hypothetical protein
MDDAAAEDTWQQQTVLVTLPNQQRNGSFCLTINKSRAKSMHHYSKHTAAFAIVIIFPANGSMTLR